MARPSIPHEYAVNFGAKNYTKAELLEKKKTELTIKADEFYPSDTLPEHLHDKFYWYVGQYEGTGLLTNLDIDTLCHYLIANEQYWLLTERMYDIGVADEEYGKVTVLQNRYHKQTLDYAKELGMTFLSRTRLKRDDKVDEDKPKSEEEQLFGDALG